MPHQAGLGRDEEWLAICRKLGVALDSGKSVGEFAGALGLQKGVTGYAYHSVSVAMLLPSSPNGFPHGNGSRSGLRG